MPWPGASALRALARRIGIPPGRIFSDLPEALGIPSFALPDLVAHWRRVLGRSSETLRNLPPARHPRVALITTIGKGVNNPGYAAVLAYALRLRGADPVLVYCDGWLDGCEQATIAYMAPEEFLERGPRPLCAMCYAPGERLYRSLGIPTYGLSEFLDEAALGEVRRFADALPREHYYDFEYKGIPLGPQVEATVARFFYTHIVDQSELGWRVAHRMVRGAVMMAAALVRLDKRLAIDVYAPHYGAYASRGTAAVTAHALGKRCVVWNRGYVEEALMFGDGQNAFTEIADRTEGPWTGQVLSPEQDRILDGILRARVAGDFKVVNPNPVEEEQALISKLQLDPARRIVALYTNVGFDTKLFYDTPSYPDVLRWVKDSIEIFAGRPEQLVVRVHPGETWLKVVDKEQTARAIRERFPVLPPNVRVIRPDDRLSSYALARIAEACLVYGSLIGLELAAQGRPIIVCGRAAYWGKGFTHDVRSRAEYEAVIDRLNEISRPDPARTAAARRFAYYFYVERQLPFAHWNHDYQPGLRLPDWWKAFRRLDDLRPGKDRDLDAICDQFLSGTEAIASTRLNA